MRLLFLSNLFPPEVLGGYEIGCANVARSMRARGHEVMVLTARSALAAGADDPPWLRRELALEQLLRHPSGEPGAHAREHHAARCSALANTLCLLERLREFRPDLVYAWNLMGIGGLGLLDLLRRLGQPWAMHLMDRLPVELLEGLSPPVRGLFGAEDGSVFAAGACLAMSRTVLDEIEALCGLRLAAPVLVPGWVRTVGAGPHGPYRADGVARFVSAGAVVPHKGVDLMLEAAAMLRAEGHRFLLDIYGWGEVPHYLALAHGMGLAEVVRFPGRRSQAELLRLYAEYDAFLFPTHAREPFGFAPLEAAACATPPILTAGCGAAERLVHGVHALKIERSAAALAAAMRQVCTGEMAVEHLGRAAARLVAEDLSEDRCMDQVETTLLAQLDPAARDAAQVRAADPRLGRQLALRHALSLALRFG